MGCEVIRSEHGTMIVCGRRGKLPECQYPGCKLIGAIQCDAAVGADRTCDRRCCPVHSESVGRNQDLCWEHLELHQMALPL